jgi:hypothetical protein
MRGVFRQPTARAAGRVRADFFNGSLGYAFMKADGRIFSKDFSRLKTGRLENSPAF